MPQPSKNPQPCTGNRIEIRFEQGCTSYYFNDELQTTNEGLILTNQDTLIVSCDFDRRLADPYAFYNLYMAFNLYRKGTEDRLSDDQMQQALSDKTGFAQVRGLGSGPASNYYSAWNLLFRNDKDKVEKLASEFSIKAQETVILGHHDHKWWLPYSLDERTKVTRIAMVIDPKGDLFDDQVAYELEVIAIFGEGHTEPADSDNIFNLTLRGRASTDDGGRSRIAIEEGTVDVVILGEDANRGKIGCIPNAILEARTE